MARLTNSAKKAASAMAAGTKKAAEVTTEFGTASVRAVNRATNYISSTSVARGVGYGLKYAIHGTANAIEAGVPLAGSFVADIMRFDDTKRLLRHSPSEQNKQLQQYNRSYDLKHFKALSEETQKSIHASASSLLGQRASEPLDVTNIEAIKNALKASEVMPQDVRRQKLAVVNNAIAGKIPKTKLSDIQRKAKKIQEGIEAGENQTVPADMLALDEPKKVNIAIRELLLTAKEEIEAERRQALTGIEELFAPTAPGAAATPFKKQLACLISGKTELNSAAEIEAIVAPHKALFIKQIEDSYVKAKESLQSKIEDKTKRKDEDGKDIPDEYGILTRAKRLEEITEMDLLVRIREYERRKAQGAVLPNKGLRAGIGRAPVTNDPACLKGISLEQIKALEVNKGRTLRNFITTSGTEISLDETTGELNIGIPGLAFPYHVVSPERLQEDFEDIVERALSKKNNLEIKWKISANTEELRHKMIIAAYKASLAKGIDPKDIKMTVNGGDEKQSFIEKPIDEILSKSQPRIIFSKEDTDFIAQKRKNLVENTKKADIATDRAFTDKFRDTLKDIRGRGIEPEDEIKLDPPSSSNKPSKSSRGPGPGA